MTRRLALAGFAAVAVLWGPYLYSEWSRDPLRPAPDYTRMLADAPEPAVPVEPVAHEPVETELAAATAEPAEPSEAIAEPEATGEPPELAEAPTDEASALALPPPAAEPAAPAAAQGSVSPPPVPPAAADPAPVAAAEPAEPAEPEAATDPVAPVAKEADKPAPSPETLAPAFRSAFDREARDVSWAGHEETRLTSLLSTAGVPEALVSEVRCQSTVCRISINAGDTPPELRSALLLRAQRELGPRFALDTSPTAESEPHASVYVLRKGYDLEAH